MNGSSYHPTLELDSQLQLLALLQSLTWEAVDHLTHQHHHLRAQAYRH